MVPVAQVDAPNSCSEKGFREHFDLGVTLMELEMSLESIECNEHEYMVVLLVCH